MSTALITGASAGIGKAFARELASRKTDLILIARTQERLQLLATELRQQFGVQVWVFPEDLTQSGAPQRIYEQVKAAGLTVDLLINNAGVGDYGEFAGRSFERQSQIVKLNVLATVELTHLFLVPMRQRGTGSIINVSSISAFQPIPYLATYSASKAFILHFSEALWAENQQLGIKVLAVCPGPTYTEFFAAADMERNPELMHSQTYETAEAVVKEALIALAKGRANVVTGSIRNQTIVNAGRLTPREWLLRLLEPKFRSKA